MNLIVFVRIKAAPLCLKTTSTSGFYNHWEGYVLY